MSLVLTQDLQQEKESRENFTFKSRFEFGAFLSVHSPLFFIPPLVAIRRPYHLTYHRPASTRSYGATTEVLIIRLLKCDT